MGRVHAILHITFIVVLDKSGMPDQGNLITWIDGLAYPSCTFYIAVWPTTEYA